MFEPGDTDSSNTFIGNYKLGKLIGSGGFGMVHSASHKNLDKRACIKIVQSDPLSEELKYVLWSEAQLLQKLNHPNIVHVEDLIVKNSQIYMVIDYVDGGDLDAILTKAPNGLLPLDEVDHILEQVAQGLHYAHQKHVIHRDLKPQNILRYQDGRVVIADFGLATVLGTAHSQSSSSNVIGIGTYAYMAPEQFDGHADYSSDLYSLGVIAYQLLTGQLPFGSGLLQAQEGHCHKSLPPLRKFNANLSPQIEQVVLKMLAKKPQDRYQSPIEFTNALHDAITKQSFKIANVNVGHVIQGTAAWLSAPQQRQKRLLPLIVVCIALLFANYGYSFFITSVSGRFLSFLSHTAGSKATSVVSQPIATSVPTISLTATPPPTVASPPTAASTPTRAGGFSIPQGWQQVLNTSFTSTGSDWASGSSDCTFTANGYQNQAKGSDTCNYGNSSDHPFTDLAYSIQVTIIKGSQAGLIFHLHNNNYYAFDISIDGTYVVTRHSDANGGNDQALLGPAHSAAIRPGLNQKNILAIIARGSRFQFWVNNLLVSATDDTNYPGGTIGTGINAFQNDQESTTALFQHVQVWTPTR